jgi:hypothetical protein
MPRRPRPSGHRPATGGVPDFDTERTRKIS